MSDKKPNQKPDEKPEVPEVEPQDPDEDVFQSFGITDAEEKHNVKKLAAARVIAHRRLNPAKPPDKKPKDSRWRPNEGEE